MSILAHHLKLLIRLFAAHVGFVADHHNRFIRWTRLDDLALLVGAANDIELGSKMRRSIVPAVFIAWIWLGTLQILGFELPLLVGVPVNLLLFGFLFWGLPPEMYWPPSTRSPKPDGRLPTWWQSVRRHRLKSLSVVVMTAWVWTFFTLQLKGATDASYFIGLSLLATIVLMYLTWAGWRAPE